MDTSEAASPAVGFWRRVGAFVIDGLLLGVVGVALGYLAFDALARIGEWARLLGLGLATAYFGVLGSALGGGQTLGQRLLKLRVTRVDGEPLPIARSLLRGLILVLPFVVNGISLRSSDGQALSFAVGLVAITALFGLGLAQLYLLVFNRPSRRLAHDLLTGSVLARTGEFSPVAPTPALHARVAMGLVAGVALLIAGVSGYFLNQSHGLYARLKSPLAAVEALPEVESATISELTSAMVTTQTGRTVSHSLVVNARLNAWPRDPQEEARRLGHAVLAVHPLAPGQNLVAVFRYGFDVGFGSSWRSYNATVTP